MIQEEEDLIVLPVCILLSRGHHHSSSMDQRNTLFIALLLKGLHFSIAGYYIEIPKTLWAVRGSCVVVPCTYTYSDPKLASRSILGIWYNAINERAKDEVFIKSNTPMNGASFIGDLGNGDCSIKIHNVRSEDSKIYKFRVEMQHFKFSYNAIVRLTVLDAPPSPILVLPNETIPEATNVSLKCSTTYTCSSDVADLVWSPPDGQVIVTRTYQGGGVWTVESKLTFQMSFSHNGMTVSCHATHHSGATSPVVRRNLWFGYKPEILPKSQCRRNVSALSCECAAIARPPANISWHSPDINVTETSGFSINSSSRGSNIMSRLEGAKIQPENLWCTVSNMEGSASQNLTIYEKPQILLDSHCIKKLSVIYCECAAIANPPPNITWHSPDSNVSEKSEFSIYATTYGLKTVSRLEGTVIPPGGLWCTAMNVEGSVTHNLPIIANWTEFILIGGGILAFLVLCITGVVFLIRKHRSNNTSNPNSNITVNTIYNKDIMTKDEMMNTQDSENIYANSDFQNKKDFKEVYTNVEEEKRKGREKRKP